MRARVDKAWLVNLHRVALDEAELARKIGAKLVERWNTAPVALDGDDPCASIEQGARQAARAGADLIDSVALADIGNGGDAGKQVAIENEILAKRLGRRQAVAGNDFAQRLGCIRGLG
jgi:hypothetical protein